MGALVTFETLYLLGNQLCGKYTRGAPVKLIFLRASLCSRGCANPVSCNICFAYPADVADAFRVDTFAGTVWLACFLNKACRLSCVLSQ